MYGAQREDCYGWWCCGWRIVVERSLVDKRRGFGKIEEIESRTESERKCIHCDEPGFIGFTGCMLREVLMSRALLMGEVRKARNFNICRLYRKF
jgi:hypothetical protein